MMFLLVLAGPITVIPLFLYVKGVELSGLGPTGMIFYITPTFQFLLGYFYYEENNYRQKITIGDSDKKKVRWFHTIKSYDGDSPSGSCCRERMVPGSI